MTKLDRIDTALTRLLGIRYPIIAGPMFLVSDAGLVAAVGNAGAIGAMPSLNWRTTDQFRGAIHEVRRLSSQPFAVNLIVNQSNVRQAPDLEVCAEEKVPLIITSLGNPKEVIKRMHAVGSKVFCDVTNLEYAKKVQDLGADGVVAVSSGAGGHAGPISPLVLVPYLKRNLSIPVICAGGVTVGEQMAAAMTLGAEGVQVGTRFIATHQAKVDDSYKQAILKANPEDIILTKKISGTPLSVIRTPYIDKLGTEVSKIEQMLLHNPKTKKYVKMLRMYLGSNKLRTAVTGPTYKEVWAAGQGVGFIHSIEDAGKVVENLVNEYAEQRAREQSAMGRPAV